MNRKPTPNWIAKLIACVTLALLLFGLAWLLGVLFPDIGVSILSLIEVRSPTVAQWLRAEQWPAPTFLVLLTAAVVLYIGFKICSKLISVHLWKSWLGAVQRWISPVPKPDHCFSLEDIQRKLFPEEGDGKKPLQLYGRTTELDWLQGQARKSQSSVAPAVRVLLLWGPHGIGKTHLLFRFATGLSKREYRDCGRWHAWSLSREFDPDKLAEGLPDAATLLLWDDVSLDDDDSHRRLRELLSRCAGRKQPLLLALSGWRPRIEGALTRDHKLVDAELEVTPLGPRDAERIYAGAAYLPETERGHPLLLRLLSLQASPTGVAGAAADLWGSCMQWGGEFAQRLLRKHALSPAACHALAVASSSDACSWPQAQAVFGLTDADHRALEKTGLLRSRQGAVWLEPLRPDLLGWAYAAHALVAIEPQVAKAWAVHAWRCDFFDTERFLHHAMTHELQAHIWVQTLHKPPLDDATAALARAKATTNAVNRYGAAQQWTSVAAELAVSQAIAEHFLAHAEIQWMRASTAMNAVNYFDAAQQRVRMAAELAVSHAIAERFPAHAEIQLVRAKAVMNAVIYDSAEQQRTSMTEALAVSQAIADRFPAHAEIQWVRANAAMIAANVYGAALQWTSMAAELAVLQAIAERFPDRVKIQAERAKGATNAVNHYGAAHQWASMEESLAVSQAIAERFAAHAEIQLERANAATNAVNRFGAAQQWTSMAAELAVSQAISERFPANAEIQLIVAKATTNAVKHDGAAEQWTSMAKALAVLQVIAERFPGDAEIQLVRVAAATGAVNHYGAAQQWTSMAESLAVSQAIAERFPEHVEIQLERTKAAANAVKHNGGVQKWTSMAAELAVLQAIAKRFPEHAEIQLVRATAAMTSVNCYGAAQQWTSMAETLAVSQVIAERFPEHVEIQLVRAKAAANAVIHYGATQQWPSIAEALVVLQSIADRLPTHMEIQQVRATAAMIAVDYYGAAQQWTLMAAELTASQSIAERFPEHVEIQLERAKAATNAVNGYGAAQQWPSMAEALAVVELLAARYPEQIDIQLHLARCLWAHGVHFQAADRPTEPIAAALKAHLQSYPQLWQMPPFDRIPGSADQAAAGDIDPAAV